MYANYMNYVWSEIEQEREKDEQNIPCSRVYMIPHKESEQVFALSAQTLSLATIICLVICVCVCVKGNKPSRVDEKTKMIQSRQECQY